MPTLHRRRIASAELYDPETDQWEMTGTLNVPLNGVPEDGLTLLKNGLALIAGGHSGNNVVRGAELYDPEAGTWRKTGSLNIGRGVNTQTMLADGRVLVAGGVDWETNEVLASVEIYDPSTETWTETGAMTTRRQVHRAVALRDGRVLVVGGSPVAEGESLSSAELYDPLTGRWKVTSPMHVERRGPAIMVLKDARVLVAGGTVDLRTEVFDPETEAWTFVGEMNEPRRMVPATLLRDGRVLLAGGAYGDRSLRFRPDHASAEIFDPSTGTWASAGSMSTSRRGHRTVVLNSGEVLVIGGFRLGVYLKSCEVFVP